MALPRKAPGLRAKREPQGIMSAPPKAGRLGKMGINQIQKKLDSGSLGPKQTARFEKRLGNLQYGRESIGGKQKLKGLTKPQNQAIRQRQNADLELGGYANEMLPEVFDAYSEEFDWGALPERVVGDDFSQWRQEQIDSTYADFTNRMEPEFAQQSEDFEQQMANRGIPMGSELYNKEKSRLEQSQNDARQSALVNAQQMAGQNAGQFFDIGTRARGSALNEDMMARNMPLNEFQNMWGATSGMDQQNLQYSQARGLQQQQHAQDRWMMKNTPRGGSGGGGSGAMWQQMGFSSPMEYYAWQQAEDRANQQWQWENNPQYQQPDQPSYGAQVGGDLLGAAIGGWASSGFNSFW